MNNYYQILGVTHDATLDQIKKAYRKRAKLLHPDVNKASNANEDFIMLNEAYEFLLQTAGNHPNRYKRAQEQAAKKAAYQHVWEQQEREKARARAQQYARMKYEAYIKTDIYKATEALNFMADFLVTVVVLLFVLGLPILSYLEHGAVALIFCAIIILPTSPLWFRFLVTVFSRAHLQQFVDKKQATLQSKLLKLTILFILNVIVFFKIALNTLMEVHWMIALYAFSMAIGVLMSDNTKGRFRKYFIRYAIAPGVISLLFITNFFISSNPTEECYWYSYRYNSPPIFTTIELNNKAYQEYKGIRIFVLKETVLGKGCIKYTFKDGILGFKSAHHIQITSDFPQPNNY